MFRSFRYDLFNYLKSYGEKNEITVDVINGIEDHVHLLIRLKTTQKISEVINLLKGASSRWINLNANMEETFKWQNGYGVFSVSEKIYRKSETIFTIKKNIINPYPTQKN